MRTKLPEVYLIGAPKAGTTSLAAWLAEHPEIYFSVPKEPYYWAADYPGLRRHHGFADFDRYLGLFSSTEAQGARLRAEGSTCYLYSERAVPDILESVRNPRFIVLLRDPVDLLASYHRSQLIALNENEPDFGVAWRRSLQGILPATRLLDAKLVDYPRIGRLGAAMERLLNNVPREHVHVIFLDDLGKDPLAVWRELTAFLGVSAFTPSFSVLNASDKMYRWAALRRLVHRPPTPLAGPVRNLRRWSQTTKNAWVGRCKATLWRPAPKPRINEALRREIAEYLADDVALLSRLLQTDLSHWLSPMSTDTEQRG